MTKRATQKIDDTIAYDVRRLKAGSCRLRFKRAVALLGDLREGSFDATTRRFGHRALLEFQRACLKKG